MGKHIDSTEQHQIHDDALEYADEATMAADTPAATLIGRVGHAISEDTYHILTSVGPTVFTQIDGGPGGKGDTGVQGDTGAASSVAGDTGIPGSQGDTGTQGDTGSGDKGDTGADSTIQGDTGITGDTGAGVQGDTGSAGSPGAQGDTGTHGDTGGPAGDTGDQGATGVQGDTGAGGGGGGDVTGPASSTDNAHARFDGTGGTGIQDGNFVEANDGSWVSTLSTAVTAAVSNVAELSHKSSGTPAVGFGAGVKFTLDASDFEDAEVGSFNFAWDEVYTTGYDRGRFRLYLSYGADGATVVPQLVMHISNRGWYDATEGNERGEGAIEIQTYRGGVSKVAAAADSMILGGWTNEINGTANEAIIIGGNNVTVNGSGDTSTVINSPNTIMDAPGAVALGGEYLLPTTVAAEVAFGNGRIGAAWAKQSSLIGGLRLVTHSDAAWYEIYTDTGTGQIVIPTDAALYIEGEVVGASTNMDSVFAFHVRCLVVNDDDVTSILAETVTIVYNTDDTDITCRVTADDTNEAIMIEVQDSTSGSAAIRWGFTMLATRIQFN